jgi:hypothetical protein
MVNSRRNIPTVDAPTLIKCPDVLCVPAPNHPQKLLPLRFTGFYLCHIKASFSTMDDRSARSMAENAF